MKRFFQPAPQPPASTQDNRAASKNTGTNSEPAHCKILSEISEPVQNEPSGSVLDTDAEYLYLGKSYYYAGCCLVERLDHQEYKGKCMWVVKREYVKMLPGMNGVESEPQKNLE